MILIIIMNKKDISLRLLTYSVKENKRDIFLDTNDSDNDCWE